MGVAKVLISTTTTDAKLGSSVIKMVVLHQVVRQSDNDRVTVVGAGVTLHEALAAADILASEGKSHTPL